MSQHKCISLPVNLSPATQTAEGPLAATLTVHCPRTDESVLLQRCAFCGHSDGLTLDPIDGSLSLRCHGVAESKTPEPGGPARQE